MLVYSAIASLDGYVAEAEGRFDWSAPDPEDGIWGWPLKVLGLLISVGAAALGAPFWYRLLDRIGSLRNTGRPPEPGW